MITISQNSFRAQLPKPTVLVFHTAGEIAWTLEHHNLTLAPSAKKTIPLHTGTPPLPFIQPRIVSVSHTFTAAGRQLWVAHLACRSRSTAPTPGPTATPRTRTSQRGILSYDHTDLPPHRSPVSASHSGTGKPTGQLGTGTLVQVTLPPIAGLAGTWWRTQETRRRHNFAEPDPRDNKAPHLTTREATLTSGATIDQDSHLARLWPTGGSTPPNSAGGHPTNAQATSRATAAPSTLRPHQMTTPNGNIRSIYQPNPVVGRARPRATSFTYAFTRQDERRAWNRHTTTNSDRNEAGNSTRAARTKAWRPAPQPPPPRPMYPSRTHRVR